MTIDTDSHNASILRWSLESRDNILFPEQSVMVGTERKLRGGAFVCSPIFGKMPSAPEYRGVTMPQHGFVRTHAHMAHQRMLSPGEQCYEFVFRNPWVHQVHVVIGESENGNTLTHRIVVTNQDKMPMPLSLGFHPYFPTFGTDFAIEHGDTYISSTAIMEGQSMRIPRRGNHMLFLRLAHRTIGIVLGGEYDGFNIWTDLLWRYICVEPIMGGHGRYRMLEPEVSIECACTMRVLG